MSWKCCAMSGSLTDKTYYWLHQKPGTKHFNWATRRRYGYVFETLDDALKAAREALAILPEDMLNYFNFIREE